LTLAWGFLVTVLVLCRVPYLAAAAESNLGWICLAENSVPASKVQNVGQVSNLPHCADAFEQSLQFDSDVGSAHAGLGLVHFLNGSFEEAIRKYAQGPSTRSSTQLQLGTALYRMGLNDLAMQIWQSAHAGPYFYWQGRKLEAEGELVPAVQMYERALQIDPEYKNAFWSRAESYDAYLVLAKAYLVLGEYAKAEELCRAWVTLAPTGKGYFYLGVALYRQFQFQAAAEAFRQAIQVDPANWRNEAGWWLGQSYEGLGRWDDALMAYQAVQETMPSARLSWSIGNVLLKRGQTDAALQSFLRGIEQDSQYPLNYIGAARLYKTQGQITSALAMYREAVQLLPAEQSLRDEMNALSGLAR
jgi:tetratricopeptide (TPR) repeat protein